MLSTFNVVTKVALLVFLPLKFIKLVNPSAFFCSFSFMNNNNKKKIKYGLCSDSLEKKKKKTVNIN